MTEVIEGTAIAVLDEQPREIVRLAQSPTPEATIELAARMATALKDIVEKQRLYATIQGKKYPQVEAWMTIGRMDNVVAREVTGGVVRLEDGAYEATVELVRLSDGMVTGRGSALCGTKGDKPWDGRPENMRRSMAVTRATSRAFRQQYSWIMALAGYEPTPADEMPADTRDVTPRHDEPIEEENGIGGLVGTVEVGKPPVDMQIRQTPDGPAWGFALTGGRRRYQALAIGPFADLLALSGIKAGTRVTVHGPVEMIAWRKGDRDMPPYPRIRIEWIQTPDGPIVPPPERVELTDEEKAAIAADLPLEAESIALFGDAAEVTA